MPFIKKVVSVTLAITTGALLMAGGDIKPTEIVPLGNSAQETPIIHNGPKTELI